MRKFRTKVGAVLTVMLCMILALSVTGIAMAADTSFVIKSEDGGFVAHDTPLTLNDDTVVVMSFSVDYVLNLGTGNIGFAVVESDYANDTLISEDNEDYGVGVAFGDTTTVYGSAENLSKDLTKSTAIVEGQLYRVVFDNYNGTLLIERAPAGTTSYQVIQRLVETKKFADGTDVYFGLFVEADANLVLAGLEYQTYTAEDSIQEIAVSGSEGITVSASENLKSVEANGQSYYANSTAIDNPGKGEVVISFSISSIEIGEDAKIGFAIGTDKDESKMYGGVKSALIELSNEVGFTTYTNFANDGDFETSVLNLSSVFFVGYRVKAVFNPKYGYFTLLLKVSEDGAYKEVYSRYGLDLPSEDFYVGFQFNGNVNIDFYGLQIYVPQMPDSYALEEVEMTSGGGIGNATGAVVTTEGSTTTISTHKNVGFNSATNQVTNVPIGSVIPLNKQGLEINEGEMMAIVLENVHGFKNEISQASPSISFNFNKSLNNTDNWNFDTNASFCGQYESGRFNYLFVPAYYAQDGASVTIDANEDGTPETLMSNGYNPMLIQTMGDVSTINDITEDGISVMAVFDPYNQMYYMYAKSANEPDYTLIHQVTMTDLRWELNGWDGPAQLEQFSMKEGKTTMYGCLRLMGDVEFSVDDMKVIKIKASDIGKNDNVTGLEGTGATVAPKGDLLYAEKSGYYGTQEAVVIPDGKAMAIEYAVEGVNYKNGSYNIGYLITKDNSIMNDTELVMFPDAKYTTISDANKDTWSLVHYKGSNDLVPAPADIMRTMLSTSGNNIRILFYNNGLARVQYRTAGNSVWNDYRDESTVVFGDTPVYVAMRLQYTYGLDYTKLRFYMVDDAEIYDGEVSAQGTASVEVTDEVLRFANIDVAIDGLNGGNVYLADNELLIGDNSTSGSVYANSTVTLVAETNDGYWFKGWYKDGKLVSKDSEIEVLVDANASYKAVYNTASYVYIENGNSDLWSSTEGYYEDGSYIGISFERENAYTAYAWTLSIVEYDADYNMNVLESYTFTVKGHAYEGNNLLTSDVLAKLAGWGSVTDNVGYGLPATLEQINQNNVLSVGAFKIVDRIGYEGDLIFSIPSVKSDEANGITRQIEVVAHYERNENVTTLITNTLYGEQYLANLAYTKNVGMWCIIAFVACSIALIIVKIIVVRKKAEKKRRENEGVIADDEVTFGVKDTKENKDINDADKANNDK